MFRRVCGQVLPDIAQVSDFLQITVHALIAYDRQAEAFFGIWDVPRIFEDGKRNRRQGMLQTEDARCLRSSFTRPFLIHQSPLLSCTRLSFVSVDTLAKASPVKAAKTKMSRTSASRGW